MAHPKGRKLPDYLRSVWTEWITPHDYGLWHDHSTPTLAGQVQEAAGLAAPHEEAPEPAFEEAPPAHRSPSPLHATAPRLASPVARARARAEEFEDLFAPEEELVGGGAGRGGSPPPLPRPSSAPRQSAAVTAAPTAAAAAAAAATAPKRALTPAAAALQSPMQKAKKQKGPVATAPRASSGVNSPSWMLSPPPQPIKTPLVDKVRGAVVSALSVALDTALAPIDAMNTHALQTLARAPKSAQKSTSQKPAAGSPAAGKAAAEAVVEAAAAAAAPASLPAGVTRDKNGYLREGAHPMKKARAAELGLKYHLTP